MDKRLQTCLDLYVPGDTGADIGTDHALLPCAVLRRGLCRHMILSDISPSALEHARQQVQRQGLEDRVTLRLADGLQALDRTCCCISVTGMGGIHMSELLLSGQPFLHNAALVLSPHRDHDRVRRALSEIGYHLTDEVLCFSNGRFYLAMRAVPGTPDRDESHLRYGSLLFEKRDALTRDYIAHQIALLREQICAREAALRPAEDLKEDLAFYLGKENAL